MQLKLAEYKDGKFEKFLELGKSFGYFDDFILVSNDYEQDFRAEYTPISDTELDGSCGPVDPTAERFALDKKDPLNRFDGLFDGRTYGEGRFVLVKDEDFDVYKHKFFSQKDERYAYGLKLNGKISCKFDSSGFIGRYVMSTLPQLIGNLMENPELFSKIHGSQN